MNYKIKKAFADYKVGDEAVTNLWLELNSKNA